MRARPLAAILLVVLGLAAIEVVLPLWPEVRARPTGLTSRGAGLVDAVVADAEVLRQHGALALLGAIDAAGYLTVSLLLALILAAAWLSRGYLGGHDAIDDDDLPRR